MATSETEPVEDLAFLTRWLGITHGGTLSGRRIEALAAAVRADERAKVLAEVEAAILGNPLCLGRNEALGKVRALNEVTG